MYQSSVRSATTGTGKTFLALVAILSLLLTSFAMARPVLAQVEHCPNHAEEEAAGNKTGSGGTDSEDGVTATATGDTLTLTNTNDSEAIVVFCAKGGDDFSGEDKASGQMTVTLAPGETQTFTFGTDISYFILYSVEVAPDIDVDKTGPELSKIGDDVTYTVTITNLGDSTAYKQSITDDQFGDLTGDPGCPAELAPSGEEGDDCVIEYTMPVPGTDADPFQNTVTAVYNSRATLDGLEGSDTDTHDVNLFQPSITVDKVASPSTVEVGEMVSYTITITNTSSLDSPPLVFAKIDDSLAGDLQGECSPSLAAADPDEQCVITYELEATAVGEMCNTVTVETHPDPFLNNIDGSDTACVTVVEAPADLGSITVVKELEECELCETFTRGRYFDGGQFDEEFAQAFPEGITVGDFGPFMSAEDVRNFEHEDPRIEQLVIQTLTLLINIDNCADLLTHELNGTPVSEIRDMALAILDNPENFSADEVSAVIEQVTAINESSQNEEGNPLTCDTESTVGVENFTFNLVGPAGEGSQDRGDRTSGQTWGDLPAGRYTLTETGPADLDCFIVSATSSTGGTIVEFDDDSVTIDLAEGADITVTVVNDCEGQQPPPPPPPADETGEMEIIKIFCAFEGVDDILSLGPVFEEPVDGFGIAAAHEDVLDDLLEDDCTLGAPAADQDGATFTVVGETDDGDAVNRTETTTWGEILTLELEAGTYTVTELGTELSATVRVEVDGDTVVIVFNYEEELPVEEGQGRIKIIKLACTGPAGVTFTVVPGDQSSAQLPAGAANCRVSDATFVLENADGDQSEPFTVGSDGIRLVPVEVAGSPYTLIETDPLDGESGEIVVTEGATTTVIVFNLTAGEGQQPTEGGQPNEGTRGGNPTGEGTLPNTATAPELSGSVPAALLALVMLTGLGAAGYAMQAEARRRR